jgi:single-strand selective monofunctional uracil DNA glycosylase
MTAPAEQLIEAAQHLREAVSGLSFAEPVVIVYNPLDYAQPSHRLYIEKYGDSRKRVVFLGMNPGPWGMVQTGVPFGEVAAVKDWLHIEAAVKKPAAEHPRRPVLGFDCRRSEVSGQRLWGLFKQRFKSPQDFFQDHFVANYCPLTFLEESGRNRTPDKLKADERRLLFEACDRHLQQLVDILQPRWLIGVGRFARECALRALANLDIQIGHILHPSPANPAANRDWAGLVTRRLLDLKIWKE